jgi:multidrug efflux pump subunit AcrB
MEERGIIAFFAGHRVAANLLMALMVLFGLWGITKLSRQVLPDIDLNIVNITVRWPGASPEDVEANVIEAIEPEVRFLDGIKKVRAMAYEGRGELQLEFKEKVDMSKALADAQSAIARITTFPQDIEKPVVSQFLQTDLVCRIQISGPFPERALKTIARDMRDELLRLGIPRVNMVGVRDSEIWVELTDDTLRALDLGVADVATRIDQASLDLPAGSIESGGVSQQLRSESLARSAPALGEIEIVSRVSGEKLRLRDVARIRETFEEGTVSQVRGERDSSVSLVLGRTRGFDSIRSQQIVTDYLERMRPTWPASLEVEMYDVFANEATQRVRMLVTNGIQGMILVLLALFVFLNGRIAVWVASGIPISIMATLGVMAALGMTLDMISMFAMIMALGMLADDAIVVGEHAETLYRAGMSARDAPVQAAKAMFAPVLAAAGTTLAAFFPILSLTGSIGQIIDALPVVMIVALTASLVECFLVLPMHLRGALMRLEAGESADRPRPAILRSLDRFQARFDRFRDTRLRAGVELCFRRRYSTLLAWLCTFWIALTLMRTGWVGFEFFAQPETDMIFGNFALSPGAPRERTEEMVRELARAAAEAESKLTAGEGGLIKHATGTIGTTENRQGETPMTGDHIGAYTVELVSGDVRSVRTYQFIHAWEQELQPIAGVERVTIFERSAGGPPGRDLDIRLSGASLKTMKAAAIAIREKLKSIPGVSGVEDNLPWGKQELVMELTDAGRAMGFTTQDVARQVRNAFEGAVAKRFTREQEEIIVRVKLAESTRVRDTIRDLYLRAPDGSEVPLTEVVTLTRRVGFSQIRREDGRREVAVAADVEPEVTTTNAVITVVERDVLPAIRQEFGVQVDFKGKAEEQAEALADMRIAVLLGLAGIYIILAWVFASYGTPFIVMALIPFGVVGAIIGHWVMGYNVNMLSLQAILGLSGVIINDTIVLVRMVRVRMAEGVAMAEAIVAGAASRLRPVLLTTLTTIGGLISLLFEGSLQAQLVQPLAVTLIFGLLLSPFLVLFFVPALIGIGADLSARFGRTAAVSIEIGRGASL